MDELKKLYEKAKELSPDWEELCQELDGSGGWQYLAELLDFKHFLDETVIFRNEPSKTLLRLALVSLLRHSSVKVFIVASFRTKVSHSFRSGNF